MRRPGRRTGPGHADAGRQSPRRRRPRLIRTVTELDADLIALHRYPDEAGERPVYAAWVAGATSRGAYFGWFAEEAGQVVSGAGLVLLDWGKARGDPNPLRARLVNVYTDPAYHRRGLARQLVQTALDEAARLCIGTVILGASAEALALYLEVGFQVSGNEMALKLPEPI